MKRVSILIGLLCLFTVAAVLSWKAPHDTTTPKANLAKLTARADIIAALTVANRHDHSQRSDIDRVWRAEYASTGARPTVAALMSTPLSKSLTRSAAQSQGQIEQIMVFDTAGCLVAADHMTHDYDQSDEDKWKRTVGAGATIPIVEASDANQRGITDQVSAAVRDADGTIVGGITLRWCNTVGGCL
jgi:hypothetical protein